VLLRFRRLASLLSAVALLASPLRGIVLCEMPHVEQEPTCHTDDHAPAPTEQVPTPCDDMSACAGVVALGARVTVPLTSAPAPRVTASIATHDDAPVRLLEPPPPRG